MTEDEFHSWCGAFCETVAAGASTDHVLCVGWDDGDQMAVAALKEAELGEVPVIEANIHHRRRRVLAMATQTGWCAEPDEETSDAWFAICVTDDRPAAMFVRRHGIDPHWWRIAIDDAPWFALSSAASLRNVKTGGSFNMKVVEDERLLRPPGEEPDPPTDVDGRV